jgi:hypothetical protein
MEQELVTAAEIGRGHLHQRKYAKLISLIGKQCLIKCWLNGIETLALWDTGAQVSILPNTWLDKHLPNVTVQEISELLSEPLVLNAANGGQIPYRGWVDLDFKHVEQCDRNSISVPILVTDNDDMKYPIMS